MNVPVIDLNTATGVVVEWGWLLITNATAVVLVLLVVVFVLGATVREPGVRRALDKARRERGVDARPEEKR